MPHQGYRAPDGSLTYSSHFALADQLFGGGLADFLADSRNSGMSLDHIHRSLIEKGINVTYYTARRWISWAVEQAAA